MKDFVHERDETVQNLAETKRLSPQKYLLNFTAKFFLKFLTNIAINLIHFAKTKVSKMKPRVNKKAPFYQTFKLKKNLMNLWRQISQIFWSFTVLNKIL
jgi:hypothetical protein